METPSTTALAAKFQAFSSHATPAQLRQLGTFLDARPNFSAPSSLLPVEELTTKLEIIDNLRQLRDKSSDDGKAPPFSNIVVSLLCLMSIDALRRLVEEPSRLYPLLGATFYLDLVIRGKGLSIPEQQSDTPSKTQHTATNKSRDTGQRDKCFFRDRQACILTSAALPEVCHILPFAITAGDSNSKLLLSWGLYTEALIGESHTKLANIVSRGRGTLDKAWNMLCLQPTLRTWWSNCLFGLKCIGVNPGNDGVHSTVQIQFQWMPRNAVRPLASAQLPYDTAVGAMLETVEHADGRGIVADVQRDSFHELQSGHMFEVALPNEDAINMKLVLDLQWAAVKLSALSGAAGVWQRGGDLEDEYGDGPGADVAATERVESWLEDLPPAPS